MREGSEREADEEKRSPDEMLAGIAAVLPIASLFVGCLWGAPFAVAGNMEILEYTFESPFMWAVVGMGVLASLVCAALVFLAALGYRVPAAAAILIACLPWLAGLADARYQTHLMASATTHVHPSDLTRFMARVLAETMVPRVFGLALSTSLLLATGVGLALGALSVGAAGRRPIGAVIGASLSLPLLGAAAMTFSGAGASASVGVLAALGVLVTGAIGGAGIGRDAPNHRSGANAVSGTAAAGLGFAAAVSVVSLSTLVDVFDAISREDLSSLGEMVLNAVGAMSTLRAVAAFGPALAVLATLGVTGWAVTRGGLSPGRVGGGVAVLIVVGLVTGLDANVSASITFTLSSMRRPVWSEVEGFEPLIFDPEDDLFEPAPDTVRPHALVLVDGVLAFDGERLSADALTRAGRPALSTLLRRLANGSSPRWDVGDAASDGAMPDAQEWLDEEPLWPIEEPNLVLAFDGRSSGATLRTVIDAASDAGIGSLSFFGLGSSDTEAFERIREDAPYVAFPFEAEVSASALIPGTVPEGMTAFSSRTWFGTIGTEPTIEIHPPRGPESVGVLAFRSDDRYPPDSPRRHSLIYLAVSNSATLAAVATVVRDLEQLHNLPFITTGAVPEAPP